MTHMQPHLTHLKLDLLFEIKRLPVSDVTKLDHEIRHNIPQISIAFILHEIAMDVTLEFYAIYSSS